jgi:hypothetical protein
MLAGRSRSGAPTRRTIRVRPTSGDPSTLGGSDPNAGGGPLDAGLGGVAGPPDNAVTDAGLEEVVDDPDAWIDAGDGSGTATGIDNGSRGAAISGAGSRAGSVRTATVGYSAEVGIRCAPATDTAEVSDGDDCDTDGGDVPRAACGPGAWVAGADTSGWSGVGAWMPAADPAGWGSGR